MRTRGEGLPRRKDKVGGVKIQVVVEIESLCARKHHLTTGKRDHRRLQERSGYHIRRAAVGFFMPLLLRAQQRPGNQGITIGGIVFVRHRIGRHRIIAPVKQPVIFVA